MDNLQLIYVRAALILAGMFTATAIVRGESVSDVRVAVVSPLPDGVELLIPSVPEFARSLHALVPEITPQLLAIGPGIAIVGNRSKREIVAYTVSFTPETSAGVAASAPITPQFKYPD